MPAANNPRIFELAKELGVKSKEILTKLDEEGIPDVKNHMSSVSLGLATTIRDWFGNEAAEEEGGVATAVETEDDSSSESAATTDSTAARKKATKARKTAARKKVKPVAKEPAATKKITKSSGADSKPAKKTTAKTKDDTTDPAPLAAKKTQTKAKVADGESKSKAKTKADDADQAEEATSIESKPADDSTKSSGDSEPERKVIMNVPDRPEDVKPVGPMLQAPKKTQLAGPKVIRVEAPDVLPTPRPRRESRSGGESMPRSGPRSGRGIGFGPDAEPGRSSGSRRNKRRSGSGADGRRSARGGDGDRGGNWREQDLREREERLSRSGGFFRHHRRDSQKKGGGGGKKTPTAAETGGPVTVSEPLTIKSLSAETGVRAADIVKKLFMAGKPTNINASISADDAIEVMLDYNIDLTVVEQKSAEEEIQEVFADRKVQDERLRPPVVTILGHVDHGKTSLLDRIRNANVAAGEAGGITQATSAFRVPVKAGDGDTERMVVFFDTPGHEAFTEMRSRGAKVTDVVVLVVAADDGVMPQTIESINHAKAADVPIIVALNKIDKQEATEENIQRIFGQLAEHGLNPTEWGGDTEIVRTSAETGDGVQDLLEHLDYQAELHEWKADFKGNAVGAVIEAQVEEGRGAVARLLVQHGQLKKGDFIVMGRAFGRVRDIVNDRDQRIDSAGPSSPVAISGLSDVPDAGDSFYVVETLKAAEAAAEERQQLERERELAAPKVTLDNIFDRLAENARKELRLIVKADVQGSVETLKKTLSEVDIEDIAISVLHSGVGGINESDITLAEASEAIVIGFNVTSSSKARQAADAKGVDIRLYDVIYDITNDVEKAAKGLLDPIHRLEVLGHAEVREVFRITKVGMVAGCYVTDGVIQRNAQIRVTRDDIVIEKDRRLEQLKRFKDDAKEVRAGQECGMKIDGYDDIKQGDILECYRSVEVERD